MYAKISGSIAQTNPKKVYIQPTSGLPMMEIIMIGWSVMYYSLREHFVHLLLYTRFTSIWWAYYYDSIYEIRLNLISSCLLFYGTFIVTSWFFLSRKKFQFIFSVLQFVPFFVRLETITERKTILAQHSIICAT